jgi:hypothetical protein
LAISGYNAKVFDGTSLPRSGVFLHNSVDEDFFIPTRGANSGTRIEPLPGGAYTGDIDDVKYLRDKLFSALKIPQSYLSQGEGAGEGDQSLSQKDLRFARTIQRLQRAVVSELTKIGLVHLYVLGYRDSDLISFDLSLNNPSKIAELQELEEWRTKFDVASAATEGFFSRRWIAEKVFNLTEDEFLRNQREMFYDRALDAKLGSVSEGASAEGSVSDIGMTPDEELDAAEALGDDSGGSETGDEGSGAGDDDSMLLAAPGKRNEPYLTPGAKGKLYYPVKSDKRDMGARKRHFQSKWSKELAGSSNRNLFNGIVKGIVNEGTADKEAELLEESRQEDEIMTINFETKQLLEKLEAKFGEKTQEEVLSERSTNDGGK